MSEEFDASWIRLNGMVIEFIPTLNGILPYISEVRRMSTSRVYTNRDRWYHIKTGKAPKDDSSSYGGYIAFPTPELIQEARRLEMLRNLENTEFEDLPYITLEQIYNIIMANKIPLAIELNEQKEIGDTIEFRAHKYKVTHCYFVTEEDGKGKTGTGSPGWHTLARRQK